MLCGQREAGQDSTQVHLALGMVLPLLQGPPTPAENTAKDPFPWCDGVQS